MVDEQEVLASLRAMDDAHQQQALVIIRALAREFPRGERAALSLVRTSPLDGYHLWKSLQNDQGGCLVGALPK